MAVEAEYWQEYEAAASHTRNTRSIDKLMKGNCGKIEAPASNYTDTKLNIGTYHGLLWSILGDHCDYFNKLLKFYRILDPKECFTNCNAYTPEVCVWITWAIIDDGHSFFG